MKSVEAPDGPSSGFTSGGELDQIAGDKAGGEAEIAQDLHQQPGRVAAGAGAQGEGLLAGLYSVLQADDVADFALHALIEADQEVQRGRADPRHLGEESRPDGGRATSASRKGRSSRASEVS